jgi:hypothetical protein
MVGVQLIELQVFGLIRKGSRNRPDAFSLTESADDFSCSFGLLLLCNLPRHIVPLAQAFHPL